jgi:hypothetical protein
MGRLSARPLTLVLVLAACDAQVTPAYLGEPLATMKGTIETRFTTETPPAEVLLLWVNIETAPERLVGDRVPVVGEFPASFTSKLYAPPPPEALNDLRRTLPAEPRLGIAWILVITTDPARAEMILSHEQVKMIDPHGILGWAEQEVIVYLEEPVPPGTFSAQILGAGTPAGFHVMHTGGKDQTSLHAISACLMATTPDAARSCADLVDPLLLEDGADRSVTVTLAPDLQTLGVPLFAFPDRVKQLFGLVPPGS